MLSVAALEPDREESRDVIDFLNSAAGLTLTILTLVGIAAGAYAKKIKPARERKEADRIAQRDAILGRPAIPDTTRPGHILYPASPGLPERMSTQEEFAVEQRARLDEMSRALVALAESHKHQAAQDKILDDHEGRLIKLEEAAVERVVAKAESAAAWRAMEAATKAQPDQEADPLP